MSKCSWLVGLFLFQTGFAFAAEPEASSASLPTAPASASRSRGIPSFLVRERWTTDFAAAQKEAAESNRRLLVLFTGSDWCPPCIQFERKVAHAHAFLSATRADFVLVKLDYPRRTEQLPAIRARNEELRERYQVNSYPSLLVISADGNESLPVDLQRPRDASDEVDLFVQAVNEVRRAK